MFKPLQDNSTSGQLFKTMEPPQPAQAVATTRISRVQVGGTDEIEDSIAVEAPLEIWVRFNAPAGQLQQKLATTLRSPGMDEDLVIGWLKGEGIINHLTDIKRIGYKQGDDQAILVDLADHIQPGRTAARRLQLLSAACGACGRSDLEAVLDRIPFQPPVEGLSIDSAVLFGLSATLSARQAAFAATGGLHACALFDPAGNLLLIREDIGRHNALDKLIGAAMMREEIDFRKSIVLLSGRAGFELVQKAAMAGIALLAAIGAPSSLALEVAREAGIALVGFLKQERFNIYHDQYSIIR